MFVLNMKPNRFLLFCFAFLACLATAFAQETPSQNTAEDALDFEALLAAIKHHDALLKSGEGEVVYTDGQPPFDSDTHIFKGRIAVSTQKILASIHREELLSLHQRQSGKLIPTPRGDLIITFIRHRNHLYLKHQWIQDSGSPCGTKI